MQKNSDVWKRERQQDRLNSYQHHEKFHTGDYKARGRSHKKKHKSHSDIWERERQQESLHRTYHGDGRHAAASRLMVYPPSFTDKDIEASPILRVLSRDKNYVYAM